MKEIKKREFITRQIVEAEIKNEYKKQIGFWGLVLAFGIVCLIISAKLTKDALGLVFTLSLLTVNVGAAAHLVYLIMQYRSKTLDFTIVKDTFTGFRFVVTRRYFLFKKYGAYLLPEPGANFYKYSKYYKMDYYKLRETSIAGDEFYLVIINKRIFYIYNTEYFELEE